MIMMRFIKTMLLLPKPWVAWVALLMAVNMMVPLIFLNTIEGQMVFATGMVGAMIMMVIFRSKGFVRLLGVGHIFWVPLVIWLLERVPEVSGIFQYWILSVIVLNSLSLMIDASDIGRYLSGDKQAMVSLES
jgi:hypothetical protein